MKKVAFCLAIFGSLAIGNVSIAAKRTMGNFVAPQGPAGGTGPIGPAGTSGCAPLISSDTKDANGCFVIKQRQQVWNVANNACEATGSWTTIDTLCDGHDGQNGQDGAPGEPGADYNPCNDLTPEEQAIKVLSESSVYVSYNSTNPQNVLGMGYWLKTRTMCAGNPQYIYEKDECYPAAGGNCSTGYEYYDCINQVTNNHYQVCLDLNSLTPPWVASTTEAENSPTRTYHAPTVSDGKYVRPGYVQETRVYEDGHIVDTAQFEDSCHQVYKQTLTRNSNADTVTTTLETVLKCQVQSPGATGWTAGTWYCLDTNTTSNSCNGYSETITSTETSRLKYHLPEMNGTTPTSPGYVYTEVSNGNTIVAGETAVKPDLCINVYKIGESSSANTILQTKKCTVRAPGDTSAGATYTTGHQYCLNVANGSCDGYDDNMDFSGMLSGKEDSACIGNNANSASVERKKTVLYTAPTGSGTYSTYSWKTTVGKLENQSVKCSGATAVIGTTLDKCEEVQRPNTNVCIGTGKVYYECTRQGNEGTASATAMGTKYNLCADGNSVFSNVVNKTDVTNNYTNPVFSPVASQEPGYLSITVGDKTLRQPDRCEPFVQQRTNASSASTGVQKCYCGGINTANSGYCDTLGKSYCLGSGITNGTCPNNLVAINSVLDTALNSQEANPCAGNTSSSTVIQNTTVVSAYSRGTKSGNLYPQIGTETIRKTACNGAQYTTVQQDTCVEIAKPSGVCTGDAKAYLQCVNSSLTSDTTYYVCKDLGNGNNSLAGKIDGKIDANYLTTNNYLTSSSTLSAANLSGTIDAGRLPSSVVTTGTGGNISTVLSNNNVVTTTNNKIDASVLPSNVVTTTNNKINASVLPDTVVTTGTGGNIATVLSDNNVVTTTNLPSNIVVTGSTGENSIGKILDANDVVTTSDLSSYVTTGNLSSAVASEVSSQVDALKTTNGMGSCTADAGDTDQVIVTCDQGSLAAAVVEALGPVLRATTGKIVRPSSGGEEG